jgi:threonine dehydratase
MDARERLRGHVLETPCVEAPALAEEAGCARLLLKRDHLQPTGSFKERGAANALALLPPRGRARGAIAASAGNHALGLARHGARLGIPVTLVMPVGAVRAKVQRCRALGAEVVLAGDRFEDAETHARQLAWERGASFIHPFDDEAVIAGQGTMGLEILEQVPDCDVLVVAVGGGGLLAGVATVVKTLRPEVRVVAVEPAAAPCFTAALLAGHPVDAPVLPTFADGLAVARAGSNTTAIAARLVDDVVTVSEDEIAWAMLRLFETDRVAVEGAGATALAAILAGRVGGISGATVVAPVCGANVDASVFARALAVGLARRTEAAIGAEVI